VVAGHRAEINQEVKEQLMRRKRTLMVAIGVLGFMVATAVTASAQATTMKWTVDGEKRKALVFPPKVAASKHPLVFVFHGHAGNMQDFAQKAHIQTLWKEAIVVYPQGVNRPTPLDPQGNSPGWQVEANQTGIGNKDLHFYDAMLATLRQTYQYQVDITRVYAVGFSNGAGFSYLLWAERDKTLAAIGVCAGRLEQSVQLTLPRPLIVIASRADKIITFRVQSWGIEAARAADNATGRGQPCGQDCTLYPSTTQTPVKTLMHPYGHIYPAWASAKIVTFFKAHPQP
jgi:polyhydroxybutyrate depolymerase